MSEVIWPWPLRRGNSPHPSKGACLLDAVSWFEYGRLGDHPGCVCPALAAYGRWLNDWLPDTPRQRLRPLIPLLAGTVDVGLKQRRLDLITERLMEVVVGSGVVGRRGRDVPLSEAHAWLNRARAWGKYRGKYNDHDRWIYTPAIAALADAIALTAVEQRWPMAQVTERCAEFERLRAA